MLGTVQDVRGPTVSVALNEGTVSGMLFVAGHGYRVGQVGSFVRIPLGYRDLFGIVAQAGAGAVPERLAAIQPYGNRWLSVELVGEGRRGGSFRRGISEYPTISDKVHLVTQNDLARIYGQPSDRGFAGVGHLASMEAIPALVDIDKLVTRHSAVVGQTGAGKSTTVAGLLVALSEADVYPSTRVLVIDVHGEYPAALRDRACVFRVNPVTDEDKPLHIPYWAMSFEELCSVTLGALEDRDAGAVLEKITALKADALESCPRDGVTRKTLTVDSPVPFSIHEFWFKLHRLVNATHYETGQEAQSEGTEAFLLDENENPVEPGDAMRVIAPRYRPHTLSGTPKIYMSSSGVNIRRPLEALASRLRDPRFDFLFRPGPWAPALGGACEEDLDSLIAGWIGHEKPVTILDLSGVPAVILTHVVGALLRILYDCLFWGRDLAEGSRARPLLVVLEEAHAYLGANTRGPAPNAARRIVKEGRKYGIGAMFVSQRPAEIDPTILSQCGTVFAMRLSNKSDRGHVTGVVSDNLEGLLATLPILRTGEVIIVGESVPLPMRAVVPPPAVNRRPDSQDPRVWDPEGLQGWNSPRRDEDYSRLIAAWRAQRPEWTKGGD